MECFSTVGLVTNGRHRRSSASSKTFLHVLHVFLVSQSYLNMNLKQTHVQIRIKTYSSYF